MNRLDAIVSQYDVNEHPFYKAWREGTLPRTALAQYAADYAPFIESVEQGWRCLGDDDHAATERQHARLWGNFRSELGKSGDASRSDASRALEAEARRAFADPVTALGALYAFEAQQPKTAKSKLEGLVRHYAMPVGPTAYFRAHAEDYGERDDLSSRATALAPADVARTEAACEELCRAMWALLDGVMPVGADAVVSRA